jgi:hypothetical protein
MMLQPEPARTAALPSRQGALPVRPKAIRRHGGAPRYDERLPRPAAFRRPDRLGPPMHPLSPGQNSYHAAASNPALDPVAEQNPLKTDPRPAF